jgi:hypothetical protein
LTELGLPLLVWWLYANKRGERVAVLRSDECSRSSAMVHMGRYFDVDPDETDQLGGERPPDLLDAPVPLDQGATRQVPPVSAIGSGQGPLREAWRQG